MPRAIHIHSDPKFIGSTNLFDRSAFDNTIVYIGDTRAVSDQRDIQVHLSGNRHDLKRAADICSDADLVVLYGLDTTKSHIVAGLPKEVTVAWRFFGAELYERNIESYLSERTLALYRAYRLPRRLWRSFVHAKFRLTHGVSIDALFAEAMMRTDLFLGLSRLEYDHLTAHWGNLPRFVQLPVFSSTPIPKSLPATDDFVVVGNSGNIWNNHLDIIQLIGNTTNDVSPSYVIPFSYGSGRYYHDAVRRQIRKSPADITLLEHFMTYADYLRLITTAKAAVVNSYRQLAMGNILAYLTHGVRIYLNSRNVIYHWLLDLGFRVSTVEDFAHALNRDSDLELSAQDKQTNLSLSRHLRSEYSQKKFVSQMLDLVQGQH